VSPPRVIGAAVIKAARRTAYMTRRRLARAAAVSPATVRMWENGSCPLYCVGYRQLRQLADAPADVATITSLARDLQDGAAEWELAGFGAAPASLAER